jgi:four helix bundle protein
MPQCIICDRAFEFACRILRFSDQLGNRGPAARHIASQLIKSGTSIGSNAEEAQEGQTKADFIAKMSISRKEARETVWWLRVAVGSGVVRADEVQWELDEARQLLAMVRAAIRTARASSSRGIGSSLLWFLISTLFARWL